IFQDAGASSLKRKIANCTGFQTAFSPLYSEAAASAEIKTAKMQEVARRMWFFRIDSWYFAASTSGSLISHFAEGFIEQANAFIDVGFGNIEHGREAK